MKRMVLASSSDRQSERIKISNQIIQDIYEILGHYNNLAGCEVWSSSDAPVFYVEVDMGDWKHEHLFLKHIMADQGFQCVGTQEEASDGDCYTAIHSFLPSADEYPTYRELFY